MLAIGIIPARLASTRLKEKMLTYINGKTLIQLTYENACKSEKLSKVIVATDDEKILNNVLSFGGEAVLTDKTHTSGTDRIAEAALNHEADIYINIQGDEPLLDSKDIDKLVGCFKDKNVDIATLAHVIDKDQAVLSDNVKVVIDMNNFALYFSRSIIPYNRDNIDRIKYYKHIGIYAYRKETLFSFVQLPESSLEKVEKLEQLRAIENGIKIKVLLTEKETISIDTKEDLKKIKEIIK